MSITFEDGVERSKCRAMGARICRHLPPEYQHLVIMIQRRASDERWCEVLIGVTVRCEETLARHDSWEQWDSTLDLQAKVGDAVTLHLRNGERAYEGVVLEVG